jgi:hypothetical protein
MVAREAKRDYDKLTSFSQPQGAAIATLRTRLSVDDCLVSEFVNLAV